MSKEKYVFLLISSFSSFSFSWICLADAPIFDLILSVKTLMYGSGGGGIGMGLLLFVMTIFGRIVSGLYGWAVPRLATTS